MAHYLPVNLKFQRPEKYLGDLATWDKAENDLKVALDAFGKTWQVWARIDE